jgi:hypothetical protein
MSSAESCVREEMRQARLKMPQVTFAEAWAQHDAAETASLNFGQKNGHSSLSGQKSKEESSPKIQR